MNPSDDVANAANGHAFDADTAVERTQLGWKGDVSTRWDVGGGPNGGYLVSIALSALRHETPFPDPLSVTSHFLSRPEAGPVDIVTEVVRSGGRHATLEARCLQGGAEYLRVLALFGDLGRAAGPTTVSAEPPSLPPPEDCLPFPADPMPGVTTGPLRDAVELRYAPTVGWARGQRSGSADYAAWVHFGDGRPVDLRSLVLFADAAPPAILEIVPSTWVPTLELTVHLRSRPAPGWIAARYRTRFLMDGYLEEESELWDGTGRLVAQSRQLALVRLSD